MVKLRKNSLNLTCACWDYYTEVPNCINLILWWSLTSSFCYIAQTVFPVFLSLCLKNKDQRRIMKVLQFFFISSPFLQPLIHYKTTKIKKSPLRLNKCLNKCFNFFFNLWLLISCHHFYNPRHITRMFQIKNKALKFLNKAH